MRFIYDNDQNGNGEKGDAKLLLVYCGLRHRDNQAGQRPDNDRQNTT
jgi:hypothetical protein